MALNSLFCADVPLRNYSLTCGKNATNFVAMATGVSWGKMQLAAFDGPSPKTPL